MKAIIAAAVLCTFGFVGWLLFKPSQYNFEIPEGPANVEFGEMTFKRFCTACHQISREDRYILAGDGAQAGPNLYQVVGRPAAVRNDFQYSTAMTLVGETGFVWTQDAIAEYIVDPKGYLRKVLENPSIRGKMAFRLKTEKGPLVAPHIAAYLASVQ
ncbi:MAG: c-type cytochrome [Planktomarina sp.]